MLCHRCRASRCRRRLPACLAALQVSYTPDYIGFDCPNKWVAGLGMDTNQLFRGMDCVTVLTPEAINKALQR
jgi:hypoxanthine-guanine phosphoribosyltransferase